MICFIPVIANDWAGPVIVVDSGGRSAPLREGTYVIDPFNMTSSQGSACFNPLDALDPDREDTIVRADTLVASIVVLRKGSHDVYWEAAAQGVLRLVLLHVLTAAQYEGRRTLATVRELAARSDWAEEVATNDAFGGLEARASRFMQMGEKEFTSVMATVLQHMDFLDSPEIRRVMSHSDFTPASLKTRSASLYLFLPPRFLHSHGGWLRVMITTAILDFPEGPQPLLCVDHAAKELLADIIERAAHSGWKVGDL